jgi:site-specific DNA recombinase
MTTNRGRVARQFPQVTGERAAREYLRVSQDRSGRERSPEEQHADNERACKARGLVLGVSYREAGSASASRYSTKSRKEFKRLLEDLEAGEFGAEVLVLWESSRGSRRVGEWVTLIELCEEQGVTIFVTTHEREYDPANARDRRSLLEDATDSEYESSKVSARATRAAAANAEAGKPHGPVPYGYVRVYDAHSGKIVRQEPHPVESELIRELFAEVIKGTSFRRISQQFAARGFVNGKGKPFSQEHLRSMALNAAYAGMRVHVPGPSSRSHRATIFTEGAKRTKGTWEPLVSWSDFLKVQKILANPKRVTTKGGGARHTFTMIARCDVCGGVLSVAAGRDVYCCRWSNHVRAARQDFEDFGTRVILEYLSREDVYELFTTGQDTGTKELEDVQTRLTVARMELDELRTNVAAGLLSVGSATVMEPGIIARIAALEEQESQLMTPTELRDLMTVGGDVAARWEELTIEARRAVARIVLSPDLLGEMRLAHRDPNYPATVRQPVAERIVWRRNEPKGRRKRGPK